MRKYPRLYSFRRCPWAIRARMALAHTQISVELREILLSERPDELYAISSKGTVPVLELEDGKVIDESFDIIMWALDQTNTDWMEINPDQQLKMIHANDHEFKPWLDKYKYHQRHPEHTKEYYQDQCDAFLSNYNEILKMQPYLIGEKIQLLDVAVFPFVRQFAFVDLQYFETKYFNLNQWLLARKDSGLFNSIMDKYIQWEPDHDPMIVSFTA